MSPTTIRIGLASALILLALAPAAHADQKTSAPPAEVTVFDGFSLAGDGLNTTSSLSGAGSLYATPAEGTLSSTSTLFSFSPSWPARYLRLTIVDPRTGSYLRDAAGTPADGYQCQGGALSAHAGVPWGPADGFLQCYNATRTLGFYVDWPPFPAKDGGGGTPCIQLGAPAAGSEIAATGAGCMAHVSLKRNGGAILQTEPGTGEAECFMVSFRLETTRIS